MNAKEGNEIIAKFMGLEYKNDSYFKRDYTNDYNMYQLCNFTGWWKDGYPTELNYNVNWNHLMGVYDKLFKYHRIFIKLGNNTATIEHMGWIEIQIQAKDNLTALWEALVNFIKKNYKY